MRLLRSAVVLLVLLLPLRRRRLLLARRSTVLLPVGVIWLALWRRTAVRLLLSVLRLLSVGGLLAVRLLALSLWWAKPSLRLGRAVRRIGGSALLVLIAALLLRRLLSRDWGRRLVLVGGWRNRSGADPRRGLGLLGWRLLLLLLWLRRRLAWPLSACDQLSGLYIW